MLRAPTFLLRSLVTSPIIKNVYCNDLIPLFPPGCGMFHPSLCGGVQPCTWRIRTAKMSHCLCDCEQDYLSGEVTYSYFAPAPACPRCSTSYEQQCSTTYKQQCNTVNEQQCETTSETSFQKSCSTQYKQVTNPGLAWSAGQALLSLGVPTCVLTLHSLCHVLYLNVSCYMLHMLLQVCSTPSYNAGTRSYGHQKRGAHSYGYQKRGVRSYDYQKRGTRSYGHQKRGTHSFGNHKRVARSYGHSAPKKSCKNVPQQSCKNVAVQKPVQKCKNVPKKSCQSVPKQTCLSEPQQSCKSVPIQTPTKMARKICKKYRG